MSACFFVTSQNIKLLFVLGAVFFEMANMGFFCLLSAQHQFACSQALLSGDPARISYCHDQGKIST